MNDAPLRPRSTISYPVPWYQIPSAIYQLYHYSRNVSNPYWINHAKYIKEKTGTEYSDWGRVAFWPPEGLKVILPSSPAVDFPFSVVPDHLVSCGPIVLPAKPLKETDPGMAVWIAKRPTVYVNLGTHATYEEADARELAGALRVLLDAAKEAGRELQVLWKLKKRGEYAGEGFAAVLDVVGSEWEENVRVTDWLEAEPMAILESGNVVCSVNHGGANSYFEAVRYEAHLQPFFFFFLFPSGGLQEPSPPSFRRSSRDSTDTLTAPASLRSSSPCGSTPTTSPRG